MLANSRYAGGRKPKAEKRPETPAKIQRVFVEVDTPQWEAHLKASGRKSFPTSTHQGKNGWWFDTEWPEPKAA